MKLHHAGLVVPNLKAAIEFYTRALGMKQVFSGGWSAPNPAFDGILGLQGTAASSALLSLDLGYLELFEFRAPAPEAAPDPSDLAPVNTGIRHLCFQTDDPAAALSAVVAAGGRAQGCLVTMPGGAIAVYCRDPFGNLLEFLKPGGRMPAHQSTGQYQ